jgi:hypothetical protein
MASRGCSPWYTDVIDQEKKKTETVQCTLCKTIFAKRLERMLSHLGYDKVAGVRTSGVSRCTNLPGAVRTLFKNCGGKFPSDTAVFMSERSSSPVTRYDLSPGVSTPTSTDVESRAGSTMATPKNEPVLVGEGIPSISALLEEGSGRVSTVKAKRQSTLREGFDETQRRDCDKA